MEDFKTGEGNGVDNKVKGGCSPYVLQLRGHNVILGVKSLENFNWTPLYN